MSAEPHDDDVMKLPLPEKASWYLKRASELDDQAIQLRIQARAHRQHGNKLLAYIKANPKQE